MSGGNGGAQAPKLRQRDLDRRVEDARVALAQATLGVEIQMAILSIATSGMETARSLKSMAESTLAQVQAEAHANLPLSRAQLDVLCMMKTGCRVRTDCTLIARNTARVLRSRGFLDVQTDARGDWYVLSPAGAKRLAAHMADLAAETETP